MKKRILQISAAFCFLAAVACLILLLLSRGSAKQAREDFSSLALVVKENSSSTSSSAFSQAEGETAVLPQYQALSEQNPDMIGWIQIPGTAIDYPVMYTPGDPDYYLDHNFQKEHSPSGTPFLGGECSWEPSSDNLMIFGHNMYAGHDMFTDLLFYKDRPFFEENPVFRFDTLREQQEFRVVAAFYSKVYQKTDDVFKFYQFIDAESREDFDAYLENVRALSLYDTGTAAEYGDQLVTLITCSLHENQGRFVVVAVKQQPK